MRIESLCCHNIGGLALLHTRAGAGQQVRCVHKAGLHRSSKEADGLQRNSQVRSTVSQMTGTRGRAACRSWREVQEGRECPAGARSLVGRAVSC